MTRYFVDTPARDHTHRRPPATLPGTPAGGARRLRRATELVTDLESRLLILIARIRVGSMRRPMPDTVTSRESVDLTAQPRRP
jgi:hypothetical protein